MSSSQVVRNCLVSIVVCWTGTLRAADGDDKLPLIDTLPADATHYGFRAGTDTLSAKLKGTPAGAIIQEEEVAAFLRSLAGMLDNHSDDATKAIWQLLKTVFRSDVVCARIPRKDDDPEIVCVAIPRSAEGRTELKKSFDAVVKIMLEKIEEDPDEFAEKVDGGVIYDRLGWVSGRMVLFDGDRARDVVLGKKPKQPLSKAEPFLKATADLKLENPVGFYYFNLRPLWNAATENGKAEAGSFGARLVASGLTSLEAMAGASNVSGGRYHNEHFWVVDERRGGLFKHVGSNPIPASWLKGIPDTAVSFTYGTWDAGDFLELLLDTPQEPEDTADEDEKADSSKKKAPEPPKVVGKLWGFDVKSELIRSLGTRYLIYRVPAGGSAVSPALMFPPFLILPPHQMVIGLELTDRAAFEREFDAFWDAAAKELAENENENGGMFFGAPAMRKIDYRKKTIYELRHIVGVYFHVAGDQLLFSTNPQLIKTAIRRAEKPGKSLADSNEFQSAYRKVPKDACFLVYLHKRSFFELLYKGYVSLAQQFGPMMIAATGGGQGVDFSFADLPTTSAISKHLKESAYLYGVAKKNGVLFDGQADLLPLSWWIAEFQILYDVMTVSSGIN